MPTSTTKTITTNQNETSRRWAAAAVMGAILLLSAVGLRGQTYTLSPAPFQYVLSTAGAIVPNGCVWTYAAGTTTPIATYADTSGTPNGNPIVADSFGRFVAYLLPGTNYKFQYENVPCSSPSTHGALIKTQDNIAGVPASAANVDVIGTAGIALTAGQCAYLSDGSGGLNQGQWYKCDSANTYSSTLPTVGIPIANIASSTTGTIRLAGYVTGLSSLTVGTPYFAGTTGALTSTAPANRRFLGIPDTTTTLILSSNPPLMPALASGTASSTTVLGGNQVWMPVLPMQSFRALTLRTHPDQASAANKVFLESAAEITTDLGTHVTPRSALAADITTSGAGGLDTGSRAVSTWYSVYYIFKGPTAASPDSPSAPASDALLLHREKNYGLDQSSTSTGAGTGINDASGHQQLGQAFTAAVTGSLEMIDIAVIRNGTPAASSVKLQIYGDTAGLPGTPIASGTAVSDALDASLMATSSQVIRYVFRTPPTLTSATKYWIVAVPTYATSGANFIQWDGTGSGANAAQYNGSTWSALGSKTFVFKEYITQNSAAVTMPSGYTDKCLIGYVFNKSSNAFAPFTQYQRSVRTMDADVRVVNGGTSAFPLLVDASAFLPPASVKMIPSFETSSTAVVIAAGVPDGYALTNSPNSKGSIQLSGVTGHVDGLGSINTEYQGIYYQAAAALIFYIAGFEW